MSVEPQTHDTKRVTISLTLKVWKWAQELMEEGGYPTISALIAALIREERIKAKNDPAKTTKGHTPNPPE